jgi:hypothetical protein
MKTPDNTQEGPADPEPAEERDIQMEYFSDYLYMASIREATKHYL